ncbi:quinoprotein alcohol dehydrogenase (cytochrome c) [Anaeramoeba flamelloides]|uniref:Quinoprotein alcohol dehydrogenase (Cytochrome c) n=1 Tax=Anaeramoeba flamelloides TaxID=1746091 RepID=A0ABQ8ZDW9_9EUKA|nr:quinoprotein alcohol dehydrogenase (cytochrome c) [Anaeramoeba flamelloides]
MKKTKIVLLLAFLILNFSKCGEWSQEDQNAQNLRYVELDSLHIAKIREKFLLQSKSQESQILNYNDQNQFYSVSSYNFQNGSGTFVRMEFNSFYPFNDEKEITMEYSSESTDTGGFLMTSVACSFQIDPPICIVNDPHSMNNYPDATISPIIGLQLSKDQQPSRVLWRLDTKTKYDQDYPMYAKVHRNKVFLSTHQDNFYVLDLITGRVLWEIKGGEKDLWQKSTKQPVVSNSGEIVIFFHSEFNYDSQMYAYDVETGKKLWNNSFGGFKFPGGAPVISRDDSTVYFLDADAIIRAIDTKTGKLKWKHRFELFVPFFPHGFTPILDQLGQNIFLILQNDSSVDRVQTVVCLSTEGDRTPQIKWEKRLSLPECDCEPPWLGSYSLFSELNKMILTKNNILIAPRWSVCESWKQNGDVDCVFQKTSLLFIDAQTGKDRNTLTIQQGKRELAPLIDCRLKYNSNSSANELICISDDSTIYRFTEE